MKERGRNILVHDYNGEIITLCNAKIWYNTGGDYVEPRRFHPLHINEKIEENPCLNLQKLVMKIFCINTKY